MVVANLRNHIVPVLGDVELAKLTPSMLRSWLSELTTKVGAHGRPLALGSVAQAYRTLNRVRSAAVDNELLGRNPLRGVKAPRVESEPMRFLSHDEVATLAEVIDPRYRALELVAAYTGLRAGELGALRRSHVDLLHQTITVVEQVQWISGNHVVSAPKSAASRRSVALPGVVTSVLKEHLKRYAEPGPGGLIFPAPAKAASCDLRTSVSASGPRRQSRRVLLHQLFRRRRGRQGAAANARSRVGCPHARPLWPPSAWPGRARGSEAGRDGASGDAGCAHGSGAYCGSILEPP